MQPFPKDLLYPCVTGSFDLSSKPALKIFICSGIKLTCRELCEDVEIVCREVFRNIYPETEDVSIRFICKWILGTPSINELTDCPIRDFSWDLMAEKSRERIPIHSDSSRSSFFWYTSPEFTLISMKVPCPKFTKNIQPICHKDKVVMVTTTMGMQQLGIYDTLTKEMKRIKYLSTDALQRLGDFMILQEDYVEAASLENMTFNSLIELAGAKFIHSFGEALLFFRCKDPAFYMLSIENRQLKTSEYPIESQIGYYSGSSALHKPSQMTFFSFKFHFSDGYKLIAFAPEMEKPIFTDWLETKAGQLVAFDDSVLFCSLDPNDHLQIERVDVTDGVIKLTSIDLKKAGEHYFTSIMSVVCQLDRLFITASYADGNHMPTVYHYFIIIDMAEQAIESIKQLGISYEQDTIITTTDLGKALITFPQYDKLQIFNMDYT